MAVDYTGRQWTDNACEHRMGLSVRRDCDGLLRLCRSRNGHTFHECELSSANACDSSGRSNTDGIGDSGQRSSDVLGDFIQRSGIRPVNSTDRDDTYRDSSPDMQSDSEFSRHHQGKHSNADVDGGERRIPWSFTGTGCWICECQWWVRGAHSEQLGYIHADSLEHHRNEYLLSSGGRECTASDVHIHKKPDRNPHR